MEVSSTTRMETISGTSSIYDDWSAFLITDLTEVTHNTHRNMNTFPKRDLKSYYPKAIACIRKLQAGTGITDAAWTAFNTEFSIFTKRYVQIGNHKISGLAKAIYQMEIAAQRPLSNIPEDLVPVEITNASGGIGILSKAVLSKTSTVYELLLKNQNTVEASSRKLQLNFPCSEDIFTLFIQDSEQKKSSSEKWAECFKSNPKDFAEMHSFAEMLNIKFILSQCHHFAVETMNEALDDRPKKPSYHPTLQNVFVQYFLPLRKQIYDYFSLSQYQRNSQEPKEMHAFKLTTAIIAYAESQQITYLNQEGFYLVPANALELSTQLKLLQTKQLLGFAPLSIRLFPLIPSDWKDDLIQKLDVLQQHSKALMQSTNTDQKITFVIPSFHTAVTEYEQAAAEYFQKNPSASISQALELQFKIQTT